MKAEFLNPFLQATINVLSTMARMSPKPGKPTVKEDDMAVGDITGIIGLTGTKNGSLAVSFSESCALKIVENMMGEKYDKLNEEVADVVGELTNMISGDARAQLQKLGFTFSAAIPTIVRGKEHSIRHIPQGGATLMIPFPERGGGRRRRRVNEYDLG